MKRREFIALGAASILGGGTGLAPAAWAQQPAGRKRVGVLGSTVAVDGSMIATARAYFDILRAALKEEGFIEGTNLTLDIRGGGNDPAVYRAVARDLAIGGYDVLISSSTAATAALSAETKNDPHRLHRRLRSQRYVQSFARPGGNVTGVTNIEVSMAGKWLEMLHDVAPGVRRAVMMTNPDAGVGYKFFGPSFRAAADALRIEPVSVEVRTLAEIDAAVATMAKVPGTGVVVPPDGYTLTNRRTVIDAVAREKLPAVYMFPEFADDGGLISYGSDNADLYRRVGGYVGLILKGAKPNDLPVQAPRKFVLTVNLKTAKAQGITIPPTLIALADKVIE